MTSRTDVIPVIAPAATRYCIQVSPTRLKSINHGRILVDFQELGPFLLRRQKTAMSRTVQMISEAMMPIGTSLDGFLASSEWTETESNPIYAKKIIAAPANMPMAGPPLAV